MNLLVSADDRKEPFASLLQTLGAPYDLAKQKQTELVTEKGIYVVLNTENFSKKNRLFYNAELLFSKDHNKQRNSGLNEAIVKKFAANEVTYCFNYALLFDRRRQARTFARMLQNATLIKKHRVKWSIINVVSEPYKIRTADDFAVLARMLKLQ
ncbi:MAG: hypothetical protein H6502_02170 [Candidatus Woesearchaeota archaeon]|nr:MAG: hypothetical protein H6502_02170 [Candidatus Woesearchaeota archaeon]